MIMACRAGIVRYPKGLVHEIDWSPGLSIHTVVAREASCGERGGACTREVGRGQVSGKNTKEKNGTPVEAKGTLNDIRLSLAGAGGDVGDGVGCHGARVDLHRVHLSAVDVGRDAEIEVGLRAGRR